MAESTASTKKADKFEQVTASNAGVTVTHEMPAAADKTSAPVHNDAKPQQPPVRTVDPQVPIAQVLGSGAGAPERPQDDIPNIGSDGRWYADVEEAKATFESGRLDEGAAKK